MISDETPTPLIRAFHPCMGVETEGLQQHAPVLDLPQRSPPQRSQGQSSASVTSDTHTISTYCKHANHSPPLASYIPVPADVNLRYHIRASLTRTRLLHKSSNHTPTIHPQLRILYHGAHRYTPPSIPSIHVCQHCAQRKDTQFKSSET
jgi:hypothetical protein